MCRAPQGLFQLCLAASAFGAIPGVAASAASSATRGTAASASSATRGIAASRSSATDASETCGGAGHCRASHTRSRTSGTRGGYFRLRCRRGPRLGIGLRCSPPTLPSPAPLAAPTGGVRRDDDRPEAIEHAPDWRRAPGAAARSRDALLVQARCDARQARYAGRLCRRCAETAQGLACRIRLQIAEIKAYGARNGRPSKIYRRIDRHSPLRRRLRRAEWESFRHARNVTA